MRTPLIAGNWKMNTTLADAVALVKRCASAWIPSAGLKGVPPFISGSSTKSGPSIKPGAQNVYFEDKAPSPARFRP